MSTSLCALRLVMGSPGEIGAMSYMQVQCPRVSCPSHSPLLLRLHHGALQQSMLQLQGSHCHAGCCNSCTKMPHLCCHKGNYAAAALCVFDLRASLSMAGLLLPAALRLKSLRTDGVPKGSV